MSEKHKSADKWQKIAKENAEENTKETKEDIKEDAEEELSALDFPTRQALEDQLTALERKAQEYQDKATRAHAELENVRARAERDISKAHRFGTERLIRAMLPVFDSLIRGLESTDSQDPKVQAMREGMQLTLDLLHKGMADFGVVSIEPKVGDTFNPQYHEAMGMQKDPNAKPNTIIQVLQVGYQLHDRVLRAAMVMVAQ